MSDKLKFSPGDQVALKGKKGTYIVHWSLFIGIPSLTRDGEFVHINRELLKFHIKGFEYFYAWADDAKPMGAKNAKVSSVRKK